MMLITNLIFHLIVLAFKLTAIPQSKICQIKLLHILHRLRKNLKNLEMQQLIDNKKTLKLTLNRFEIWNRNFYKEDKRKNNKSFNNNKNNRSISKRHKNRARLKN